MELYTKISFPEIKPKFNYDSQAIFIGSCFSENIGGWLRNLKFNVGSNFTGIIYNPLSIARHISYGINDLMVSMDDMVESRGRFVHTDFHSAFNMPDKNLAFTKINQANKSLKEGLLKSDFVFITFGTAIAFEKKSTGEIVNNCHHLPSGEFSKRMLDESEMYEAMHRAITLLGTKNPKTTIILTISPIRHLRHGAIENNRSKARLIRLCELLENDFANCTYLPIYEFVMDELRDYRFYRQDDFIHLNELGIGLIQEKFIESIFSKDVLSLMERVKKYNLMAAHKIQNSNSEESKKFLLKIENETAELEKLLPGRF